MKRVYSEKAYKFLLHGQCWPSNLHDFVKMDLYLFEGQKSEAPNAKWSCGGIQAQIVGVESLFISGTPAHYLRFRGRPQQNRDYE